MKRPNITERLNSNDRAVSPVIGVILMVAITVILAAVIGTFVLDLGQSAGNSAPSASLSVSANPSTDNVTVSHKGGDGLNNEQTRVIVEAAGGSTTWEPQADGSGDTLSVGNEANFNLSAVGGTVQAEWGDNTGWAPDGTGSTSTFESGDQISVTLIDTESQRVIYETTITA